MQDRFKHMWKSEKHMKLLLFFFEQIDNGLSNFPIALCGKSCKFEQKEWKYVVFATPVAQKRIHWGICFISDLLSAQMNVLNTKF